MSITKKFEIRHQNALSLMDLRGEKRWCAWQTEFRKNGDGQEIPVKKPIGKGGADFKANHPDTWMTWYEASRLSRMGGGTGIVLGPVQGSGLSLIGVDFDTCMEGSEGDLAAWAQEILSALGAVYTEISPSGTGLKSFMLVRDDEIDSIRSILNIPRWWRPWKMPGIARHAPGIEFVLGHRYFTVMRGGPDPLGIVTLDRIEVVGALLMKWFGDGSGGRARGAGGDVEVTDAMIRSLELPDEQEALTEADRVLLRGHPALQALWDQTYKFGSDKSGSSVAFNVAKELHKAGFEQAEGVRLLMKHDRVWAYYEDKGEWEGRRQIARAWFRSTTAGTNIKLGTIEMPQPETPVGLPSGDDSEPPASSGVLDIISDGSLARWTVDDHWHELRYVKERGEWLMYNGTHWAPDRTGKVRRMVHETCIRVAARPTTPGKLIPVLMSARATRDAESLAQVDPRVSARSDEWDSHPWLLNTPGGTIDLRTGKTGPNDQRHMLTQITPVEIDREGAHPHWSTFLSQVTGGDLELEGYLRRVAGYCLTGSIREQAMFFLYGEGSNGKGTFVGVLMNILGIEGYAQNAPPELFTTRRHERHTAEIARLRGARLVTTSETEEGKAWAESRIKDMTGGSPITAQFMRQNYFTFLPEFKLMISGNHKPRIRSVDNAIKRRLNLIPFLVSFIGKQDPDLGEKLKSEYGRILAWAVRGCQEWQLNGLQPPQKVIDATNDYMHEEDSKSIWFEECCTFDRRLTCETRETDLFASWNVWATKAGEFVGSQKSLGDWLQKRRMEFGKNDSRQRVWKGVSIISFGISQQLDLTGKIVSFPSKKDTE